MQIKKLVDTINRTYIQSDYLRQPDIYYYMDRVIDDINERLNACYPTFSEWDEYVELYNMRYKPFPPKPVNGPCPPEQPHLPGDPGLPEEDRPLPPKGPCVPNRCEPCRPDIFCPYAHPKDRTIYDVIPDKYLRSVVALGTALYFYEADEEGEQIAIDYQQRYEQQLFYMVRDYQMLVPPEFQNNAGGYIDFSYERELGPCNLHPRGVVMRGNNSKVL